MFWDKLESALLWLLMLASFSGAGVLAYSSI